ncbi:unnamed protein product [Brassica rapa subsp. narinosa]|uniref:(rape) hypothetical protein n=1 Tax=Brassica napus TaxID=3708 RepID=A0A816TKC9_BRANA|nr:unnamed protein product [Brassica napus]
MEAITDPSTPAFFREVEAPSASPPPVLVPGNGRLSLLRLHRFWLRRVEAHIALRCRIRSPFSFGSGLGGICGVAFVARVVVRMKLSIDGDNDKRRKAEVACMIGMSSRLVR